MISLGLSPIMHFLLVDEYYLCRIVLLTIEGLKHTARKEPIRWRAPGEQRVTESQKRAHFDGESRDFRHMEISSR